MTEGPPQAPRKCTASWWTRTRRLTPHPLRHSPGHSSPVRQYPHSSQFCPPLRLSVLVRPGLQTVFPSRGRGPDTQRRGGGPSEPVGEDTEVQWAVATRQGMVGVQLEGASTGL